MARNEMPNSSGVTGLKGKNWAVELANNRVDFLFKELKNGGQALTYEELKELVNKKVPGGQPMGEKTVKRAVFAVEHNIPVKSFDDLGTVKLPMGGGARKWEEEREKRRVEAETHPHGVKLCKRGHERTPENVNKNGACKLCQNLLQKGRKKKVMKAKAKRRMHPLEAITRAQESSLDNISSSVNSLPAELHSWLKEDIAPLMEKHKLKSITLTLLSDGPHASWELAPIMGITKL